MALVAWALGSTTAAGADEPPRARRVANYTIHAAYDDATHKVSADETITWHNTTKASANDLYFHLYLNAFANSESSFLREMGSERKDFVERHAEPWGYVDVAKVRVRGVDLTSQLTFVQPDDDNVDDHTVARLPLPWPISPGEEATIEVEFVSKLPPVAARAGYAGPFAMVAQWFPKLGVFEGGRWNCHQYHLTTEFFADFGVYDVTLTLPHDDVVGATGVLTETHENGDGSKTLRFVAEDVHDFAWAADARFQVVEREIEGVEVRLLLQPLHRGQAERHLAALASALGRYRKWFGPYPYRQLTVIDPGPRAGGAGGMEYPMLITVGTTWWMPKGLRIPELTAIHEFGHQYWYGIVANNEFEEAWLDEGINSFVESSIVEAEMGSTVLDLFGLRSGLLPIMRASYLRSTQQDPVARSGWKYLDRDSYAAISYSKTALALETLDRYLGENAVKKALATYFERWQYRHPHGSDFFAALKDSSGQDLDWYIDQTFRGTEVLDYAVTKVTSEETSSFTGYPFTGQRVGELAQTTTPESVQFRSEVVVERLGGIEMPVEVQVVFDDGSSVMEKWDGRERWKRFEYTGPQRVEWALVDPNQRLVLDVNFLNNSRMRAAATRGVVRVVGRWTFWFQNLLYFATGL